MSIVKIKPHGEFTEEHVEIVKRNLREDCFPQLYTNSEFKTLKFKGTHLVPESSILRSGHGSSQSARYAGLNQKYPELKQDILENGWRLYEKPIALRETKDKKYVFIDGRTKDKILGEQNYKNRIANIYTIDDSEKELFDGRFNSGESSPPAGLIQIEDVIGIVHRQIKNGYLKLDAEEILEAVNLICGQGKFSSNKRDEIRWQIFHRLNNVQNDDGLPIAWANSGEVNVWLQLHNYINNNKVMYLPYSSTSAPKAIIAAASKAQQNPGKEIRVVIYIRNFMGYDLDKFYVKSMLKFKAEWYRFLTELSNGYFDNTLPVDTRIKLYACVPSNIKGICDDMEHLIIFGKNDQKIDDSYFTNSSLSQFLDVDNEEEDDE